MHPVDTLATGLLHNRITRRQMLCLLGVGAPSGCATSPIGGGSILAKLKQTVIEDGNVFAVLIDAIKYCSLGQISSALYEVGASIAAVCKKSIAGRIQRRESSKPEPVREDESKKDGEAMYLAVFHGVREVFSLD